jgi:hypothetical protein
LIEIIGNMSIAKGMYLVMGLLLKGENLEAKSTQHQQKVSNFA